VLPAGFPPGNPATGHHASKLVLTCHDRLPLSTPARTHGWRLMAKWFFGSGLAAASDATRCSGSASTVIADTAIAVPLAALKPGSSSDAVPTAATSGAWKDDSIIATGSGNIGNAEPAARADGSRFPIDRFSGIIRMWDLKVNTGSCSVPVQRHFCSGLALAANCRVLALPPLRTKQPFR
jgi:hypothetical protein